MQFVYFVPIVKGYGYSKRLIYCCPKLEHKSIFLFLYRVYIVLKYMMNTSFKSIVYV